MFSSRVLNCGVTTPFPCQSALRWLSTIEFPFDKCFPGTGSTVALYDFYTCHLPEDGSLTTNEKVPMEEAAHQHYHMPVSASQALVNLQQFAFWEYHF